MDNKKLSQGKKLLWQNQEYKNHVLQARKKNKIRKQV